MNSFGWHKFLKKKVQQKLHPQLMSLPKLQTFKFSKNQIFIPQIKPKPSSHHNGKLI
jgi:hypothetical protein